MANREQVKLLERGVEAWNAWREDNLDQATDLSGADLHDANLRDAKLRDAFLYEADLRGADLSVANLSGAHLRNADLFGAHLTRADLSGANLTGADLSGANLSGANLTGANLTRVDLTGANLIGADLNRTSLYRARIGGTALGRVDLSETIGLKDVKHYASSTLGTDTMVLSKGKTPEVFLRGCGLSDWEIEAAKLYDRNLSNQDAVEILYRVADIRASQPIQISPLFISYSHADHEFVDALESRLNNKGVRFWRDIHDATSGRLEKQIDRAIRINSTVLLILSQNSIKSDWVEHEVRLARELEKETQRDVLCPVALDDGWKTSPWPKRLMEQVMEYNILDFSKWRDGDSFKKTFVKLIDGLNLYYKK